MVATVKMFDINNQMVRANVDPRQYPVRGSDSLSSFQQEVGEKLLDKFTLYNILEEWPIPSSRLTLDFFIPQLGFVIEADGEQHRKFSKFFHGTVDNFLKQKERDKKKDLWCEANGFKMIRVVKAEEVDSI